MHSIHWSMVLKKLDTNIEYGLSDKDVEERRLSDFDNVLEDLRKGEKSRLYKMIRSRTFIFTILLAITSFNYSYTLGVIYLSMVVIMIFLSSFRGTENLEFENINSSLVRVKRNGNIKKIPTSELVRGDIVFFDEGDTAPADMRIIQSANLSVAEGFLTGNKMGSFKFASELDEELQLEEKSNIVFKGSYCITGYSVAVVIETGMNTEIGKRLRVMMNRDNKFNLLKILDKGINPFIILTVLSGLVEYSVMGAISEYSLWVFPILIPLYALTYYIYIKSDFLDNGVEMFNFDNIRKLAQINNLNIDIEDAFFSEGHKLLDLYIADKKYRLHPGMNVSNYSLNRAMEILGVCARNTRKNIEGVVYQTYNEFIEDLEDKGIVKLPKTVMDVPYDHERASVTRIIKHKGAYRVYSMAELNVILDNCTSCLSQQIEKPITPFEKVNIKNLDLELSKKGYQTMALCYRTFNYEPSLKENIESNLVYVGLISYQAKVREDSKETIDLIQQMNVKLNLFTNDNKVLALNKGNLIGVKYIDKEIISGIEIRHMSNKELLSSIEKYKVFSKFGTRDKQRMALALNTKKLNSMYIGERVGDFYTLKQGELALSKGKSISGMCKKLCDLHMDDVNLGSLLKSMVESKKILYTIVDFYKSLVNVVSTLTAINIISFVLRKGYVFSGLEFTVINIFLLTFMAYVYMLNTASRDVNIYEIPSINKKDQIKRMFKIMIGVAAISSIIMLMPIYFGYIRLLLMFIVFSVVGFETFNNHRSLKGKANLIYIIFIVVAAAYLMFYI